MLANAGHLLRSLAMVSGTAGIVDARQRAERRAKDDGLAAVLCRIGLQTFAEQWYQQPLWRSLKAHPRWEAMHQTTDFLTSHVVLF